jgi:hypothetical protein
MHWRLRHPITYYDTLGATYNWHVTPHALTHAAVVGHEP